MLVPAAPSEGILRMTEREVFTLHETQIEILEKRGYFCGICGLHSSFYGTPQLAHRVPQTKRNIKLYGKKLIHHIDNLTLTCSLACNKKAELPRYQWAEHMKKIQEGEY